MPAAANGKFCMPSSKQTSLSRRSTPLISNALSSMLQILASRQEYLLSRELDEAARCVRELGASHFHHELVKRGVKIAMEKDGMDHMDNSATSSLDAMAALFSFLVKNSIVSEYQVAKGIARLRRLLTDLKLDVPAAPAMLDEFEEMAREGGCLPGAAAIEASD